MISNNGRPASDAIFGSFVGQTVAYDGDFNEVARGQESDEGLYLHHQEQNENFGERYIVMRGSDPLCAAGLAPPIDVEHYWRLAVDGNFTISGHHDKAPDHEAMYRADHYFADDWVEAACAYRFANKGFPNLANPIQAVMDVNFNPELGAFPDCAIQ